MITDKDRETLGPLLGSRYTTEVIDVLKKHGINPHKTKPYSPGFITNVYLGVYENADVEQALLEVAEARKSKKDGIEWMRNRLTSESA